jgi:hypothetical protein
MTSTGEECKIRLKDEEPGAIVYRADGYSHIPHAFDHRHSKSREAETAVEQELRTPLDARGVRSFIASETMEDGFGVGIHCVLFSATKTAEFGNILKIWIITGI